MAGSLFDRLTMGPAGGRISDEESIRLSLLRMLTTRQGAAQAQPDYGLPDLNDLSLTRSEIIQQSCKAIKNCVERYEPRLCNVLVKCVKQQNGNPTMFFNISASRVDADGRKFPWTWDITMSGEKVKDSNEF